MIIRTKSAYDYSSVDERCLTHNGVIVDCGCLGWDWSQFFFGKKRVIGVDPFENEIDGAELFKGCLTDMDGQIDISNNSDESSCMAFLQGDKSKTPVPSLTFKTFCKRYNIHSISVLKLNIEGGEYSLLKSFDAEDFKMIDQIAISFHDWINPNWKEYTENAIKNLELNGFTVTKLKSDWGWYLAIKK